MFTRFNKGISLRTMTQPSRSKKKHNQRRIQQLSPSRFHIFGEYHVSKSRWSTESGHINLTRSHSFVVQITLHQPRSLYILMEGTDWIFHFLLFLQQSFDKLRLVLYVCLCNIRPKYKMLPCPCRKFVPPPTKRYQCCFVSMNGTQTCSSLCHSMTVHHFNQYQASKANRNTSSHDGVPLGAVLSSTEIFN